MVCASFMSLTESPSPQESFSRIRLDSGEVSDVSRSVFPCGQGGRQECLQARAARGCARTSRRGQCWRGGHLSRPWKSAGGADPPRSPHAHAVRTRDGGGAREGRARGGPERSVSPGEILEGFARL